MAINLLKLAHEVRWSGMSRAACMRRWRGLSLASHLLVLALAPLCLLMAACLLLQAVEPPPAQAPARLSRGVAAVRLLATAVESGVHLRRPQQLDQVVDALAGLDEVVAVAIYDDAARPLLERGRVGVVSQAQILAVRSAGFIDERGGRLAFAAPVMVMPAAREDGIGDALFTVAAPQTTGWVLLELDAATAPSDPSMPSHALLVLAALAGSTYAALRLAHRWSDPMRRLAHAARRIRAGHWETRVAVDGAGRELRQLQDDFNSLAGVMEETHRALQAGVDEATGRFAYQAMHDHLTGLPNRRAFDKALDEAVAASRRASDRCVLCFIDLDFFKTVNDVGGHAAGDALLREVAGLLQQGVRAEDLTSRIGGDEFALILRNCSTDDARRIVDSLCRAIEALRFWWAGRVFTVSASFGLAEIDATVESCASVLKIADDACYAAKRGGRNQVVLRGAESPTGIA